MIAVAHRNVNILGTTSFVQARTMVPYGGDSAVSLRSPATGRKTAAEQVDWQPWEVAKPGAVLTAEAPLPARHSVESSCQASPVLRGSRPEAGGRLRRADQHRRRCRTALEAQPSWSLGVWSYAHSQRVSPKSSQVGKSRKRQGKRSFGPPDPSPQGAHALGNLAFYKIGPTLKKFARAGRGSIPFGLPPIRWFTTETDERGLTPTMRSLLARQQEQV